MNLLLVGGGHAMLPALQHARRWTARGVRVTLLDENRYLYYSGMVPEYVGGVYRRDEVRIDLKRLCDTAGVELVQEPAERLDPERRRVHTSTGRTFSYDVAAFGIGARNPSPTPNAIRTKPLHHIEELASRLRTALDASSEPLRLLIAGGGAAGVEVALNITGRFAARNRQEALHLTVVEGSHHLLPRFPAGLSTYVTQALERRGVQLHTSALVTAVRDRQAVLSDRRTLSADHVLWSTGSVGPPLFEAAGLLCDELGFVRVAPTLQCMGYPRLFAAGDCATVAGHEALRKVGVHAVKQGPVLRTNLDRALHAIRAGHPPDDGALDAFSPYPAAPLILSTGTSEGIWTAGPLWFHGRPFLRLKHFLDRRWIRRYNPLWQSARPLRLVDATAADT